LAVTLRIQTLLARSGADSQLLDEFIELARDLQMAADLEEIRLRKSDSKDGTFAVERAAGEYAAAFATVGVDVETLKPAEAASRIEARTIADELTAALDDWASIRGRTDQAGAKRLRAVARLADPNPQRNRVRDAPEGRQSKGLKELAAADTDDLPPSTVVLLAAALLRANAQESALAVLSRAQRRRPDDFWLNHELAFVLTKTKPARLEEALRFYTAALALRPQSP